MKNETQNKQKNLKQGFTLLELLVVVLIISILAAIALPQYKLAKEKAKFAELMQYLNPLYEAQQIYYLVHGTYAEDIKDLDTHLNFYSDNIIQKTTLWFININNHNFEHKRLFYSIIEIFWRSIQKQINNQILDSITHIFGTFDKVITFIGFKCSSGKTVYFGKPNGKSFIFGIYGKKVQYCDRMLLITC